MRAQAVIDLLTEKGFLDPADAGHVLAAARVAEGGIVQAVVDAGVFQDANHLYSVIAEDIGAPFLDLSNFDPPKELLAIIPGGMARLHGAFPVHIDAQGLQIALVDPLDPQGVEDLRFALGKEIIVIVADSARVEELINANYADSSANDFLEGMGISAGDTGEDKIDLRALAEEANSAPIIRYVDLVLYQAIKERASDIHFEPYSKEFRIRYRVDGALYEMAPPPLHLKESIISRIKVMANMNIAERRLPQDGRIKKSVDGRDVDMRVSTLPIQHGESVVLRVLDRSAVSLDLEVLGMPANVYNYICDTIMKPNGIFICTGPTGAGKTTTLYAALQRINTMDSKILTAEDPVEYDIDGIIQIPVNESIGLSFARVLRAFLRQDPDRIMIGEMRDLETAQIAIQASLTGHLVLSTLHTNDAPGAVTRLVDMGCEPFLVAATLEAVLAQRLVRMICKDCRSPYLPSESILNQLGLTRDDIGNKEFYTGEGCVTCGHGGYKGRKGLYELLDMSDPLRELITNKASTLKLRQKAVELGLVGLREDGLRSIFEGETTIEEVLKYT